jgi:hypothetical protein
MTAYDPTSHRAQRLTTERHTQQHKRRHKRSLQHLSAHAIARFDLYPYIGVEPGHALHA